jgi:hypothetical protein
MSEVGYSIKESYKKGDKTMTKQYSVSLTTSTTTYITTVSSDTDTPDDYDLAMLAVSRINEEEGFDLTPLRWEIQVEEVG